MNKEASERKLAILLPDHRPAGPADKRPPINQVGIAEQITRSRTVASARTKMKKFVTQTNSLKAFHAYVQRPDFPASGFTAGEELAAIAFASNVPRTDIVEALAVLELDDVFSYLDALTTGLSPGTFWDTRNSRLALAVHAGHGFRAIAGHLAPENAATVALFVLMTAREGNKIPLSTADVDMAFSVLRSASPSVFAGLRQADPTAAALLSTSPEALAQWADCTGPEGVAPGAADRYADAPEPWIASWAVASGASPEARQRAAENHGPRILLTAGVRGGTSQDLEVLRHQTELGDVALWAHAVLESSPRSPADISDLVKVLLLSDTKADKTLAWLMCGQYEEWVPSLDEVEALARHLIPTSQDFHNFEASDLAHPAAVRTVLSSPGLYRNMTTPLFGSDVALLKVFNAHLADHPVADDLVAAAVDTWEGSFGDLVATLRVVDA